MLEVLSQQRRSRGPSCDTASCSTSLPVPGTASIVVEKPDGLVLVQPCGRLILHDLQLSKQLDEPQAEDLPGGQKALLGTAKEAEDGVDVLQLMFAEQAALND